MIPSKIIIHHEAGNNGFDSVNEYHRQLWNFKSELGFYIGYQYYISKIGKVYQGRKDTEEGAHTQGQNLNSIGICLQGNFDFERPTLAQFISLKSLINKKMMEYGILPANISGHRMFAAKDCPGNLISEAELKALFQPDTSYIQTMILKIQQMIIQFKMKLGGIKDKYI